MNLLSRKLFVAISLLALLGGCKSAQKEYSYKPGEYAYAPKTPTEIPATIEYSASKADEGCSAYVSSVNGAFIGAIELNPQIKDNQITLSPGITTVVFRAWANTDMNVHYSEGSWLNQISSDGKKWHTQGSITQDLDVKPGEHYNIQIDDTSLRIKDSKGKIVKEGKFDLLREVVY
jgi:hypothetical protein